MTSYCLASTCLNGNCSGCKNGSKYCNDPRCYPNCPDCSGETSVTCSNGRTGWDWVLIITIGILVLLVLILFIVMRYQNKTENKTSEYQEITIIQPNIQVPNDQYGQYGQQYDQQYDQYDQYNLPSENLPSENFNAVLNSFTPSLETLPESIDSVSENRENIESRENIENSNYDPSLDASLNYIPESIYISPKPIYQNSFTRTIPNIPSASIPSPSNVSISSFSNKVQNNEQTNKGQNNEQTNNNERIRGFI